MGLLTIESGDHIGYVIKKNPDSGMIKKSIRSCEMSGFYKIGTKNKYMVYGVDYDGGTSFSIEGNDDDKYLNLLNYCSSSFILSAISNFFDTALKKEDKDDISYDHIFYVNSVSMSEKTSTTIEKLAKYFNGIELIITNKLAKKSLTFKAKDTTFNYLLNVVFVIATTIACLNNEQIDNSDSFIEKIIKCMNRCNAPYFVRYYFSSRILTKNNFNKYKKLLEQHNSHKLKLHFGSTLQQRINCIENKLTFTLPLIDIGCGEGNYLVPFSRKLKDKQYMGFDIDEDELKKSNGKIKQKDIDNATVTNDINEVYKKCEELGIVEVLITEVIEHMELDKVRSFIEDIINNINFSKIIVTTPNHDFNVNYDMDTKFRHHDHKWELGEKEFREFVKTINFPENCKLKFFNVGDEVDDVCCSLGLEVVKS